jgi:Protein of unknown function (DUF3307)
MLLIKWICAHLIADYLLQSSAMVRHKKRLKEKSWMLYVHCLLHGLLIYLFTAQWSNFWLPLVVAVSHFFIDWWKLNRPDKTIYFITDQLLHIAVLVSLFLMTQISREDFITWFSYWWKNEKMWAIAMGYMLLVWPLSFLIGYLTQRWRNDIGVQLERTAASLAEAGKWIGMFERILIFTFVITNQYAGVGLLIAAKSILRFNETKKESGRKESEYILIGTLISFAFAILTGLFILQIIQE